MMVETDFYAPKMKTAFVITLLWLIVTLTGCVGVLPVPSDGQTYGKVMTPGEVSFILPGQTSRAEVIARLCEQFRDSPRLPVLAYSWETPAVGLAVFMASMDVAGGGTLSAATGGHFL